jgi:hypothetical protein
LQCPHCHQTHLENGLLCPVDGKQKMPAQTWLPILLAMLIIPMLLACSVLQNLLPTPTTLAETTTATKQSVLQATDTAEIPLATQKPPLAEARFPEQTIDYPSEWPTSLRFPVEFRLVEANAGSIKSGAPKGYTTKLRFTGDPQRATEQLISFFTSQGWQIADQSALDSGGFFLLIKKNDQKNQGILVIDKDPTDPNATLIVATIFP